MTHSEWVIDQSGFVYIPSWWAIGLGFCPPPWPPPPPPPAAPDGPIWTGGWFIWFTDSLKRKKNDFWKIKSTASQKLIKFTNQEWPHLIKEARLVGETRRRHRQFYIFLRRFRIYNFEKMTHRLFGSILISIIDWESGSTFINECWCFGKTFFG